MARAPQKPDFPWWLVVVAATGLYLLWQILSDPTYARILSTLSRGIGITVGVAVVAYAAACAIGLLVAVAAGSRSIVIRQAARLYVEVLRGVPIILLLLYVAFVATPAAVSGWNWLAERLDLPSLRTRDISYLWRATAALALAYSAFLAEVFRAGLQSVPEGQREAAIALGLRPWARFRRVIFPQALRTILPALGNDFVAMVKDSSLVSILGVLDVTQIGKVSAAGNFLYFETYNVMGLIYLTMTIGLSILLRRLELRLRARA